MSQSKKANDTLDNVKEALENARQETANIAGQAISKGEEMWEQARSKGEETWKAAQQKGREIFDEVAKESKQGVSTARQYVKKNPGKSLGIAVLAGVILGALFFSGSSDEE